MAQTSQQKTEASPAQAARVYQIQYTNKTDRYDAHERILSVGGRGNNGSLWVLTQEEAVSAIASGRLDFYVEVGGQRLRVMIAEHESGQPYLKTETDGVQPHTLLDLPECRWVLDFLRTRTSSS